MANLEKWTDLFDIASRLVTPLGDRPSHTDAEMWQYVRTATRRVIQLLKARGVTSMLGVAEATVTAGTAYMAGDIGSYGYISTPLRLWERPSSDTNGWVPMQMAHPLPLNQEAGDYFRYWYFRRRDTTATEIVFPAACTRNMVVRVEGPTNIFIVGTTPLQDFFLVGVMEPAAHFAASMIMTARKDYAAAAIFERQGMEFVDGVVAEDTHHKQVQPARMYAVRSGLRDRWW